MTQLFVKSIMKIKIWTWWWLDKTEESMNQTLLLFCLGSSIELKRGNAYFYIYKIDSFRVFCKIADRC